MLRWILAYQDSLSVMNKQTKNKKLTPKRTVGKRVKKHIHKTVNTHPPKLFKRLSIAILLFLLLFGIINYAIAYWYQQKHKNDPLVIGTTFVAPYARYYGLDPKDTLSAMINDIGFTHFRLVSYWDEIETSPGKYDFSDLDWQFRMIEESKGNVSLSIGLRQPRWPECHMPQWAMNMPMEEWEPRLNQFMKVTMERYKDSPALESYQLENEFFLDVFGICPDHSRERLIREYNFVKTIDDSKPIIITRSNNALGIPVGKPQPDEFGVSIYKRVWDKTITKRYFEYPLPPWFYGTLAGAGEILTGKNLIIHELQTEAWLPDTGEFAMNDLNDLDEQYKSMNAERLEDRFTYAKDTGMRTMYTWGAEWWYWHKVKAQNPSMWLIAKEEVRKAAEQNAKLETNAAND